MGDLHVADLLAVDREVARGATLLVRWRAALARDPESAEREDPLEPVRPVAGKSFREALEALEPSVVDRPLRDAFDSDFVVLHAACPVCKKSRSACAV